MRGEHIMSLVSLLVNRYLSLSEQPRTLSQLMALTTNRQLRAARALLGWEQKDLAAAAHVSEVTIRRMEKAKGVLVGRHETVQRLAIALETAGVVFTARGVELREQVEAAGS